MVTPRERYEKANVWLAAAKAEVAAAKAEALVTCWALDGGMLSPGIVVPDASAVGGLRVPVFAGADVSRVPDAWRIDGRAVLWSFPVTVGDPTSAWILVRDQAGVGGTWSACEPFGDEAREMVATIAASHDEGEEGHVGVVPCARCRTMGWPEERPPRWRVVHEANGERLVAVANGEVAEIRRSGRLYGAPKEFVVVVENGVVQLRATTWR